MHSGDIIELGDATLVVQQKAMSRTPWQIWEHSYFEARLVEECSRPRKSFAVVMVQVPKSVPDEMVEDALGQCLRPGDVVATDAPRGVRVSPAGRSRGGRRGSL